MVGERGKEVGRSIDRRPPVFRPLDSSVPTPTVQYLYIFRRDHAPRSSARKRPLSAQSKSSGSPGEFLGSPGEFVGPRCCDRGKYPSRALSLGSPRAHQVSWRVLGAAIVGKPITRHPWPSSAHSLPSKYFWEDDQVWENIPLASTPSGGPPGWPHRSKFINIFILPCICIILLAE